jgi:tetratricopeptide (TPR) repeat protein
MRFKNILYFKIYCFIYSDIGYIFYFKKNFKEAIECYKRVIKIDPNNVVVCQDKGRF